MDILVRVVICRNVFVSYEISSLYLSANQGSSNYLKVYSKPGVIESQMQLGRLLTRSAYSFPFTSAASANCICFLLDLSILYTGLVNGL